MQRGEGASSQPARKRARVIEDDLEEEEEPEGTPLVWFFDTPVTLSKHEMANH
jgi:hypothetical protein